MKKIFVVILSVMALAACSSPYYPEYRPLVALGAETSALVCENTEDNVNLRVISNVEFDATLTSGTEWLKFADENGEAIPDVVFSGSGNMSLKFKHLQNNNEKRVAYLVLSSDTRRDTVKIKQKGRFEDFLDIHDDDKERFENNRLEVESDGGDVSFRLRTSCMDHELSAWTSDKTIVSGFKFENSVFSFRVSENDEQQPRIVTIRISYVDGWDDTKTLEFTIRQKQPRL
jgi:hypothetical protein